MSDLKLNPKIGQADIEQLPTRNGYGEGILDLAMNNPNIVVLTADLAESTRVLEFAKKFPQQFVEVGVAEQNMMGLAAGLALTGKVPFVSSYAVFSPGRSWDQLRVSVCYSEANVKVVGAHTGVSVGPDGATHQALEDIAITRVLPNLVVVVPCDSIQTRKATVAIGQMMGPAYLRITREKTPVITTSDTPFEIGKAQVLREGKDVTIIACGPLVYEALLAAEELSRQQIEAEVINNHTIKPIDTETIVSSAKKTGRVVTLEEHQVIGGMGSGVCECLAENWPVPVIRLGMQDRFGESGEPRELLEKFGMTATDVVKACKKIMGSKQ